MFTFSYSTRWRTGKPHLLSPASTIPDFNEQPGRYRVVTASPTMEPITTMGGVRILPDIDPVRN